MIDSKEKGHSEETQVWDSTLRGDITYVSDYSVTEIKFDQA